MLKHFVEFYCKKENYEDVIIREIEERSINKSDTPEGTYAYRFYDCVEKNIHGVKRMCKPQNYSAKTYYGKSYTKEEILKNFVGDTSILFSMNIMGATSAVRTYNGVWKPLGLRDTVVDIEIGRQ